jgi:arsenate reductase (glutaredoxin)
MPSSTIKVYEYKSCSTCQKALKYLDKKSLQYERLPIVEKPPSVGELKTMLGYLKAAGGSFKNLFNTSGLQYRELKISDKIKAGMTEDEAIQLLSKNGKLIKRPFLLTEDGGAVGFNEAVWAKLL